MPSWVCDACTFVNDGPGDRQHCELCKSAKPSANARRQACWECPSCTFINDDTNAACEICAQPAAPGAAPSVPGPSSSSRAGYAIDLRDSPPERQPPAGTSSGSYIMDVCGCSTSFQEASAALSAAVGGFCAGATPAGGLSNFCCAALSCPSPNCGRLLSNRDLRELIGPQQAGRLYARLHEAFKARARRAAAAALATAAAASGSAMPSSGGAGGSSSSRVGGSQSHHPQGEPAPAAADPSCPTCKVRLVSRVRVEQHNDFGLTQLRVALRARTLVRTGPYEEGAARLLAHVGSRCQWLCGTCSYHEALEGGDKEQAGRRSGQGAGASSSSAAAAVEQQLTDAVRCVQHVMTLRGLLTGQRLDVAVAAPPAAAAANAAQLKQQPASRRSGPSPGKGRGGQKQKHQQHQLSYGPKGTGYGGSHGGPEFSARAAEAVARKQADDDKALTEVLVQLRGLVESYRGSGSGGGRVAQQLLVVPPLVCAALLGGCDLPFCLWLLLQNDSLTDVSRRAPLYTPLLAFLSLLGGSMDLVQLFTLPAQPPDDDKDGGGKDDGDKGGADDGAQAGPSGGSGGPSPPSVLGAMDKLCRQCEIFKRHCGRQLEDGDDDDDVAALALALEIPTVYESLKADVAVWSANVGKRWKDGAALAEAARKGKQQAVGAAPRSGQQTPGRKRGAAAEANAAAAAGSSKRQATGGASAAATTPAEQAAAEALRRRRAADAAYVDALRPLQFAERPLLSTDHYFRQAAAKASSAGGELMRKRLKRITEEISTLSTSLPLSADSSILLAVDCDRLDVLRALILPGLDTPYALGAFVFDILLPPEYPDKPPMVQFLTTGAGRYRFNPNLYNCGKVCLSLLGTWAGPSWQPGVSTLLQVLISVQAMILGVADPYFNEPGHDSNRGAMGMSASRQYNSTIRAQTLDAAVAPALQGPKGGLPGYATFGEALQLHFWHKREALASVVDRWVGEAAPGDEKSRISSLAAKIKPLLGAMQPPQQQAAADMDLG